MYKVALVSDCAVHMAEVLAKHNLLALVVGFTPHNENSESFKDSVIKLIKNKLKAHGSTMAVAKRYGIPYRLFPSSDQQMLANWLISYEIDFLVTFSAPVLQQPVIRAVKVAALNAHSAMLPSYSGGNPFLWQVIAGVDQIGLTIHRLSEKVDAGSILFQEATPMPVNQDKQTLIRTTDRLAAEGVIIIIEGYKKNGALVDLVLEQRQGSKAPNLQRKHLATQFDWINGDVQVLFRLVKYLGKWPVDIAAPNGVYRFLPLKAVGYKSVEANETLGMQLTKTGLIYGVSSGLIILKPTYNPIDILRHIKESRRLNRGELKEQYL